MLPVTFFRRSFVLKAAFANGPYGLSYIGVFVVAGASELVNALFLFLVWVGLIFSA